MKNKIFIVIAVIVALSGFVFWGSRTKTKMNPRPSPMPTASQPGSSANEQLKQLGPLPSANTSDADKGAFAEKLRSLAQSVNFVNIGKNCVLSPAIVSLRSGSNLTFRNKDTLDHSLGTTEEIKVMAGKEITIEAVFNGPGTYGITCDGPNIVGFIDLTE